MLWRQCITFLVVITSVGVNLTEMESEKGFTNDLKMDNISSDFFNTLTEGGINNSMEMGNISSQFLSTPTFNSSLGNSSEETTDAGSKDDDGPKLMTVEEYEAMRKIINYMHYPVEVIGIIFCVFSIIVYSRKAMRSPSSLFLVAVNLSELVNIVIFSIWGLMATIYGTTRRESFAYHVVTLHLNIYINTAVKRSTYCYILLLTFDRFIAVTYPLKYRDLKLVKRPICVVLAIFVTALIFHIFAELRYTIYNKGNNVYTLYVSEMYLNNLHVFGAISVASKVIFVFLPLICSLILNVATTIALRRHGRKRKDMVGGDDSDRAAKERQITITLVTASFVFILLAAPVNVALFIGIVSTEMSDAGKERPFYHGLITIGGWFEQLTNCVDFVCYITISSQFRKTFLSLFSRFSVRCCANNPTSADTTESVETTRP